MNGLVLRMGIWQVHFIAFLMWWIREFQEGQFLPCNTAQLIAKCPSKNACYFLVKESKNENLLLVLKSFCLQLLWFLKKRNVHVLYVKHYSQKVMQICCKKKLFFLSGFFFHKNSRITGLQGKGEGISLTSHYHFQPLHRHLDISWEITAESPTLSIASSRTRSGNLWFQVTNHYATRL